MAVGATGSSSANETILRAQELFIEAEKRGDQATMNAAHEMAEQARRNGGTIGSDQTLEQSKQVVQQEQYKAGNPSYSVKPPLPTYNVPQVTATYASRDTSSSRALAPKLTTSNTANGPSTTSIKSVTAATSNSSTTSTNNVNSDKNQALDEIARAQVAYNEYIKVGRADLANEAANYANQQRDKLKGMGVPESQYQDVDLRSRYTGTGSAGAYDSTKAGQVVVTPSPSTQKPTPSAPAQPTTPPPSQTPKPTPPPTRTPTLEDKDVQKTLNEIGRAQQAYSDYEKSGRLDLAEEAHAYADEQRQKLKSMGVDEKYYAPDVNLSWRYTGTGSAGVYDPKQSGMVVQTPTTSSGSKTTSAPPPTSVNDPRVQKLLDEIGRSQAAYHYYADAGRQDLADESGLYANEQRALLKSWGIDDKYYYNTVDLRSRYKSDAPPGAWDPTKPGHVPLITVTVQGVSVPPSGLDKDLYDTQVQWWDAKINLRDTKVYEDKAKDLRAKGAKDTDASRLLGELNSQVYQAVVDKYNAIVNVDADAYNHALRVIKAGRAMGSTLTSDNTKLDQANLQILSNKTAYWNAKMVGRDTLAFEKSSHAAHAAGATITDSPTELDELNAEIAKTISQRYDAWVQGDLSAQNGAINKVKSLSSQGEAYGWLGMVGGSSGTTTLDTLNQQVIDAKYAWWSAHLDVLNGKSGAVQREDQAAASAKAARDSGATIPVNTKLDALNQAVYDQVKDFKTEFQKYNYDVAAKKLVEIRDLQAQGASIGLSKQSYMTQVGLDQVLLQVQAIWWEGTANADTKSQTLATETADMLRGKEFQAKNTEQGRVMGIQNALFLDARENYWLAYANLDDAGIKSAMSQMKSAMLHGASLVDTEYQVDRDNKQILHDKILRGINKGDLVREKSFADDAESIRTHADRDYVLPNVVTELDRTMERWYQAKKDRWEAEATGGDQLDAIQAGLAAFNKLVDFDKNHRGILLKDLKRDPNGAADSNNAVPFVIDVQNRAVLDNRSRIQSLVKEGNYEGAEQVLADTKALLSKGATLDIEKLVKIERPKTGNANELRGNILDEAKKWLGKIPYQYGGVRKVNFNTDVLPKSMDCSAFTNSVYYTVLNQEIGDTTYEQYDNLNAQGKVHQITDYSQLKVGDLIFSSFESENDHVGIYAGIINGVPMEIHEGPQSGNSPGNVKYTPIAYMNAKYYGRVIEDGAGGSAGAGDKSSIGSPAEFKQKYGSLIEQKARELQVDPNVLAGVILVESGGSGFVDNNLKIRFESHIFLGSGTSDLLKYGSPKWTGQMYRNNTNEAWKEIHTGDQSSEYAAFEVAKRLDEADAYGSISMGMAQIMGFNYKAAGYGSAKEMFDDFSQGNDNQIKGFITFIGNYNNGGLMKALHSGDLRSFISQYNGDGNVDNYEAKLRVYIDEYKHASGRQAVSVNHAAQTPVKDWFAAAGRFSGVPGGGNTGIGGGLFVAQGKGKITLPIGSTASMNTGVVGPASGNTGIGGGLFVAQGTGKITLPIGPTANRNTGVVGPASGNTGIGGGVFVAQGKTQANVTPSPSTSKNAGVVGPGTSIPQMSDLIAAAKQAYLAAMGTRRSAESSSSNLVTTKK